MATNRGDRRGPPHRALTSGFATVRSAGQSPRMRRSPRSTSLGGFADRSPGSLVVAHAEQVGGVVERAVLRAGR